MENHHAVHISNNGSFNYWPWGRLNYNISWLVKKYCLTFLALVSVLNNGSNFFHSKTAVSLIMDEYGCDRWLIKEG